MVEQDTDVASEVRKLNRQWMAAYPNRDIAFLQRHMSDDYIGTYPDGTTHDKSSEIEAVKSGSIAITSMEPREMSVRVYDNVAVLTGQSSIKARIDGQDVSAEMRFTDVWIKQGNEWLAVASQVTRIEKTQDAA